MYYVDQNKTSETKEQLVAHNKHCESDDKNRPTEGVPSVNAFNLYIYNSKLFAHAFTEVEINIHGGDVSILRKQDNSNGPLKHKHILWHLLLHKSVSRMFQIMLRRVNIFDTLMILKPKNTTLET